MPQGRFGPRPDRWRVLLALAYGLETYGSSPTYLRISQALGWDGVRLPHRRVLRHIGKLRETRLVCYDAESGRGLRLTEAGWQQAYHLRAQPDFVPILVAPPMNKKPRPHAVSVAAGRKGGLTTKQRAMQGQYSL